jgi:glutamate-ammonia-ligase adenylyltransferase
MKTGEFQRILANPQGTQQWLAGIGTVDEVRALANLKRIIASGLSDEGVSNLAAQLNAHLPVVSDPDLALNNLERFVSSVRSAKALGEQFVVDQTLVPTLLMIFSNSQYLSDILVRDHDCFVAMQKHEGRLHASKSLASDICEKIGLCRDEREAMTVLRQFKRSQMIRVGYGDLIDGHRIAQVTQQLSYVATAICEAAYQFARRELEKKWGTPQNSDGEKSKFVILAMGKLGGMELNYSSDIDLMMIYDQDGETTAKPALSNREFYARLTRSVVRLINEITPLGAAYRVDLRLRPEGAKGAVCHSKEAALKYYDFQGRTWERQAMIKAQPIAGDLALGKDFLKQLQDWVYRISMSRSDISGIKALKRKIERRAVQKGEQSTNVKTGHGGIRDIEFAIQFMQLLNGAAIKNLRTTNTLTAIGRLERSGCLTMAEATLLSQNYCWLRKLEHRLQIMYDLQTHTLPDSKRELEKIALRMGYAPFLGETPLAQFRRYLAEKTEVNHKILNHLLHGDFGPDTLLGEENAEDLNDVPIEVELVLEPEPTEEMIEEALSPYGFSNVKTAYRIVMELAQEKTRFLSPRRCKYFFASIAKPLLTQISKTPDPDATLIALSLVSDSLGVKGVLWELFRFNAPTLELYVLLCSSSDYLVNIFRSNPGMIDELMDALQLQQLPTREQLEETLEELMGGAIEPDLILRSFKSTCHLRIGIRDILGRDDITDTHQTLTDVAELCLKTVTRFRYQALIQKYAADPERIIPLEDVPFVILALGKLGGREPNYHSDLDVIFMYDACPTFEASLKSDTGSQFFFSQLAADITRSITQSTARGQLYELDSRLRPTGKSGSLAVSMDEFLRYFRTGKGQLWERQSLCKARVVFGSPAVVEKAILCVEEALLTKPWKDSMAAEIKAMRLAMQKDASDENIKRGVGGTVDVEFAVQMLQLKHMQDEQSVRTPGTVDAINELVKAQKLDAGLGGSLMRSYQFLRSVEARLRLMNVVARHDLPTEPKQLEKLAYLLKYPDGDSLKWAVDSCRTQVRADFEQIVS